MGTKSGDLRRKLIEYDALRRRLWINGQRLHHGATGMAFAALGCLALPPAAAVRQPAAARSMVALAAAGGALMAHDWKDRPLWFERGRGSQP